MRQFDVKEIYALDGKGKAVAGTIEPVHSGYWLDSDDGPGKAYLFGLTRQGRALAQADRLHLVVTPSGEVALQRDVMVKVLFTDVFGVERVSRGDYWDDLPELHRFRAQNKLADELMDRAPPLFPFQRERHPYQGVAFAVTGLDGLDALFPPE